MRAAALLALLLSLLPGASLACTGDALLTCAIGAKQLAVCADMGSLIYEFGPKGNPELTLKSDMATGPVTPWPGAGGSIWESAVFHNDATSYEIWISVDRNDDAHLMEAGVDVMKGEVTIASLTCDPASLTSNGVFALSDAMGAAGYCWNLDLQAWGTACP